MAADQVSWLGKRTFDRCMNKNCISIFNSIHSVLAREVSKPVRFIYFRILVMICGQEISFLIH